MNNTTPPPKKKKTAIILPVGVNLAHTVRDCLKHSTKGHFSHDGQSMLYDVYVTDYKGNEAGTSVAFLHFSFKHYAND